MGGPHHDVTHENAFRMRVHVDGDETVVVLGGDVDLASGGELEDGIRGAAAHGHRLVFDLRRVTFMDSTGIKVILAANERAEVVMRAPGPVVRKLLELTGIDQVVAIEDETPEPAGR